MKKFYLLLVGLVSFIGISSVKADILNFDYSLDEYSNANLTEVELSNLLEENIDNIIDYWDSNYKSTYPYYYIEINSVVIGNRIDVYLHMFDAIPTNIHFYRGEITASTTIGSLLVNSIRCTEGNTCYNNLFLDKNSTNSSWYFLPSFYERSINYEVTYRHYLPFSYYDSNFDLIFNESDNFSVIQDNETLFTLTNGDVIPTYKSLNHNTYYREINLNNYPYIALSLKDYTQNSFFTNIYTKGQLCITPVYDYGMKDKTEYYSGYQVQGCTSYYDNFTPVKTYILEQDINHHAIYYVKAYDTTKENKIKVDLSVFDITYITSENANNPIVNINGRNYSTIPYDELSSTSTESEENGYISGESINVIDSFNSESISSIFSNPLNALKGVWGAIVSFLALITTFIALLPPTMQAFLYMAFSIAIILGIIKILL